MEKTTTILSCVALLLGATSASMQIMHPKELKSQFGANGTVPSSLGNFGHIIYGSTTLGKVHYPISNQNGCAKFDRKDFSSDLLADQASDLNSVVLVDRGNCTFVTKVRNIEQLGVKMAIIADSYKEDSENLIMADDGTGKSINIPSFIIRFVDGEKIKAVLAKNTSVFIKNELEMVHPDNRVEYEMWYSSILDFEKKQIFDIANYQRALQNNSLFTPRILTYSCKYCAQEVKDKNCLSDGDYCPFMAKHELPKRLKSVTDMALLEESLRQRCLYNSLASQKEVNSNFTTWFDYIVKFRDVCDSKDRFNKECSYQIMNEFNIDTTAVDECFLSSFESRGNKQSDNLILRDDRALSQKLGIVLHPAITINNMTYRGDINGYDIFRAICAGFDKQPEICQGDNVRDVIDNDDGALGRRSHHATLIHVIVGIIAVIAINFLALWCYRRYTKRKNNQQLQEHVNSAVSQYFRLSGQDA